jgi:hypothetical protein
MPTSSIMYLQDQRKFPQIAILGLKISHLATLIEPLAFSGPPKLHPALRPAEGARRDVHVGAGAAVRAVAAPPQEREADAAVHRHHPLRLLAKHRGSNPVSSRNKLCFKYFLSIYFQISNFQIFFKHLFFSNTHNDNAFEVSTTPLQCIKT